MRQLKHLTVELCPHCVSNVESIRFQGNHCNGEQFEEIQFECGCVIKWVPNFSRQEEASPCGRTPRKCKIVQEPYAQTAEVLGISRDEVLEQVGVGTITLKPNLEYRLHLLGWKLDPLKK